MRSYAATGGSPIRARTRPLLAAAGLLLALTAPSWAQSHGGILDLGSVRAQRAVVVQPGSGTPSAEAEPQMLQSLRGVLADLKNKHLDELRACLPLSPFLGDAGTGEPLCIIHLTGKDPRKPKDTADELKKSVSVYRSPSGGFVAVETDASDPRPRRAELRREEFASLLAAWPQYRGAFEPCADPTGSAFELPKPYEAGRFVIDPPTLSARFQHGARANLAGTERKLDQEKLFVRLPRGYDPRRPAGLLVWIDPTMQGIPPEPLTAALDDLNIIAVGAASAGNARQVVDRYQLVFDGVATVSRRYHVDPRRIYLTGVSGGGRVSSILLGCFPDVFAGAVPIVGLSCYANVPNGVGGWWRSGYSRPGSALFNQLKTRRMAPMTGQKDFNQTEMQHATDIMRRDGLTIRLLDYPDMAHELPRPDRFAEALSWVDEPYRTLRKSEEEAATKAMAAYTARHGDATPPDEAARRMLHKVMESGPWTPPAWRAAELLGAAQPRRQPAEK